MVEERVLQRMSAAPIPVLVNPQAGGGRRARRELAGALRTLGLSVDLREVPPTRLAEEVARAAGRRPPAVAVGGGDGSVRTAAGVLAGTPTPLAVLPLGTLNSFARQLGLQRMHAAIQALAAPRVVCVPVGRVDGEVFLNTATFGEYARVVRRRETLRRWLGKWPGALVAFLAVAARLRPLEVDLETPGERLERATPLVWVGIGRDSFPRGSEARVRTASELEVVVLPAGGKVTTVRTLALFLRLLRGGSRDAADLPGLEVLHSSRVTLRSRGPVAATLDGELRSLPSPVAVRIEEDALRVLVPPELPA